MICVPAPVLIWKASKFRGTSPVRAAIWRPVASGLVTSPESPNPSTLYCTQSLNCSVQPYMA